MVVCRQVNGSQNLEVSPDAPVWLSGVKCAGTETALSQCSHDGWAPPTSQQDCTQAVVSCAALTREFPSVMHSLNITALLTYTASVSTAPVQPEGAAPGNIACIIVIAPFIMATPLPSIQLLSQSH